MPRIVPVPCAQDAWDPSFTSQDSAQTSVGFAFVDVASQRLYVVSVSQKLDSLPRCERQVLP